MLLHFGGDWYVLKNCFIWEFAGEHKTRKCPVSTLMW